MRPFLQELLQLASVRLLSLLAVHQTHHLAAASLASALAGMLAVRYSTQTSP